MKRKTLFLISIISLFLAAGCLYAATHYLDSLAKEKLFTKVVKVAKGKKILPFQPITTQDVVLELEEVDEIQQGAVQSLDEVLGKQSIQSIFAGEQVLAQKLKDGYLLPAKGKARYEFPLSTIMPITELRKGDFVKVWVRYKSPSEMQMLPAPKYFSKSNSSADLLFESQLVTVKDTNGIEIYTLQPQLLPDADQMGDTFFKASKANQYVDSERRYWDYRSQPSAVPSYVGFNLTDNQYQKLTEAMHYGTVQFGHITLSKEGAAF